MNMSIENKQVYEKAQSHFDAIIEKRNASYHFKQFKGLVENNKFLQKFWRIIEGARKIIDRIECLLKKNLKKKEEVISTPKSERWIEFDENVRDLPKGTNICYLMTFFNEYGERLWDKIGMTTIRIKDRARQIMNYYFKTLTGGQKVVVRAVYNCNGVPATFFENQGHNMMLKMGQENYIPNDRTTMEVSVDRFFKAMARAKRDWEDE